uniref:Uncharacterized protein n=1 Tax=Schistocephalus solidus TaxID=70667 RepID=A0A0X3PGX1_SCHSO
MVISQTKANTYQVKPKNSNNFWAFRLRLCVLQYSITTCEGCGFVNPNLSLNSSSGSRKPKNNSSTAQVYKHFTGKMPYRAHCTHRTANPFAAVPFCRVHQLRWGIRWWIFWRIFPNSYVFRSV